MSTKEGAAQMRKEFKAKASIRTRGTDVRVSASHGKPILEIEKTGPFASLTILDLNPAQALKLGKALIAAAKATK